MRLESLFAWRSSHRLEPASAVGSWFLVALLDPVLTATRQPVPFDREERKRVIGANRRVRDVHFRDCRISLRNDLKHLDRPALRVAAVELDEVRSTADTDSGVRPFEHKVLGDQLSDGIPVPRLNPTPEFGDDVARFHSSIIAARESVARRL